MEFPTNMSSPARIPAFEARLNPQDGQDLSLGMTLDESNDIYNIQYAAGGVRSSPLASCPPSIPTSYDQLRALLSTCFSTEVNAGRGFGLPNSDYPFNTSYQGSELSSSSSSSPTSSIASPVGEELSLSFASPDLSFDDLAINDQDPLQACQYPVDLSFLANGQPYPNPPKQSFFPPVALPELHCAANMPVIADQSVGIHNAGAFPGSNFPAVPPFSDTTALGLYYPSTTQSLDIPPLSIQADASILSALPPANDPPAETRKVRAVAPTARAKRVRSGRTEAVAAAAIAASNAFGTGKGGLLECGICGFQQSTGRQGDFDRHKRTHQDAKLTRVVCCGIHAAHPAAAKLGPGKSSRFYKGHQFLGGCGKSYSRMDALKRHLRTSDCASGTAKDHRIWRKLYF
jgi:hypothetical protein